MIITDELLDYVAQLSRLQIADDSRDKLRTDLAGIIDQMELLKEVDTTDVEPMSHVFRITNVTREDEVLPSSPREDLLANAPKQDGSGFLVPKAVE
jgi:aspartyl-tRNA(Asn)/glutamyl-tRNA(Gln) amidotransferase subunit C